MIRDKSLFSLRWHLTTFKEIVGSEMIAWGWRSCAGGANAQRLSISLSQCVPYVRYSTLLYLQIVVVVTAHNQQRSLFLVSTWDRPLRSASM